VKTAAGAVAKNGLSFHSSVFYQATLEDSQLSLNGVGATATTTRNETCFDTCFKKDLIYFCYLPPFKTRLKYVYLVLTRE
jgi:hypothetical protein